MSEFWSSALFGGSGLLAVACGLLVVTRRNPIYSALFLIIVFGAIAIDFFLLGAEFLGFMQLLVYAGAIMVLYLFVIMLINPREDRLPDEGSATDRWVAFGVSLLIFALLFTAITKSERLDSFADISAMPALVEDHGTTKAFGLEMFTKHLLVFELTSVLVLIAIVGAVHLSMRPRRRSVGSSAADRDQHPALSAEAEDRASREEHAHV